MAEALAKSRSAIVGVAVLSAVLNVLLLAGSIYMMLIYDSVLPSHSLPTLVGLLIMVSVIYLFQGVFDVFRSRILTDIAVSLDLAVTGRVQQAVSMISLRGNGRDAMTPMRDLDQIRSFLSGPGPAALIDLPWIVFFLGILYLLHFWLGFTATAGALILVALTVATDRLTRAQTEALSSAASERHGVAEASRRHVEVIQALGMQRRMRGRWEQANRAFLKTQLALANVGGSLGGASKVFRLFLQSLVLTVGALLVIYGEATGGVIFASSILAARALAPVDQAIVNWRGFIAARQGWERLNQLLPHIPDEAPAITALPAPAQSIAAERLTVVPPGSERPAVQDLSFRLQAGEALGVVGPSASGKSSLMRALVGVWLPAQGTIRLDGAELRQWDPEQQGKHIGYLPQRVELFDGTVAQNIGRFDPLASSEDVIAAARAAGVHDMILRLPGGYETPVGSNGETLSAGQRQRLALARALYGNPFLVVLDEPNSNLDSEGEAALELAIKRVRDHKGIVIIVAHRPAALAQVSHVLFLRGGRMEAFGEREEVLNKILAKRQPAAPPHQQLKEQGA